MFKSGWFLHCWLIVLVFLLIGREESFAVYVLPICYFLRVGCFWRTGSCIPKLTSPPVRHTHKKMHSHSRWAWLLVCICVDIHAVFRRVACHCFLLLFGFISQFLHHFYRPGIFWWGVIQVLSRPQPAIIKIN